MEMEEVLVARMASFEHIFASSAKMERLSSRISGTASITKSTSERSESSVVFVIRERISSASAEVIRCLAMSLDNRVSVSFFAKRQMNDVSKRFVRAIHDREGNILRSNVQIRTCTYP